MNDPSFQTVIRVFLCARRSPQDFCDLNEPFIVNGPLTLLRVPPSELGLATLNKRPVVLDAGMHFLHAPGFEWNGTVTVNNNHITNHPLHIIRIVPGSLGLATVAKKPIILGERAPRAPPSARAPCPGAVDPNRSEMHVHHPIGGRGDRAPWRPRAQSGGSRWGLTPRRARACRRRASERPGWSAGGRNCRRARAAARKDQGGGRREGGGTSHDLEARSWDVQGHGTFQGATRRRSSARARHSGA